MLEVWVTDETGARRPLSSYGDPGPVSFSSVWRRSGGCGDASATVTLYAPTGSTPAGLRVESRFEVTDAGLLVFSGKLAAPAQGVPWRLTAFGDLTENYSTRGITVADTAIDAAISRGWQVTRPTTISAVALPTGNDVGEVPYATVPELLNALAEGGSTRWGLTVHREVFLREDATTPTWVHTAPYAVQGVSDENYAATVELFYVKALDGTPPAPSEWDRKYSGTGVPEVFIDVTDRGLLSDVEAQLLADDLLSSYGPRVHYDQAFTLDAGSLVHYDSGAPGRVSQVRAGDVVRMSTVLDQDGLSLSGGVADVLVGEVTYDEEAGTAACIPFDSVDRSLAGSVEKSFKRTVEQRRKGRA